MRKAQG